MARDDLEPFSRLLRHGLAARRMSGAELARLLDVTTSAVQRWTAGLSAPDSATVERAEVALGLAPGLLMHAISEPAEAFDPFDSRYIAQWMEDVEANSLGYAEFAADDPDAGEVGTAPDRYDSPHSGVSSSASLVLPDADGTVRDVTVGELVGLWLRTHPIPPTDEAGERDAGT